MKRTERGRKAGGKTPSPGRMGILGKLLIRLGLLVAFIIALVWVCQIALLYGFYQNYRSGQVRAAANAIVRNIDHEGLEELADRISADNEVCMLLVDGEGNRLLSIDHVRFCVLHRMTPRELEKQIAKTPEDGTELVEMVSVVPFRNDRYHEDEFEGAVPRGKSGSGRSMLYSKRVTFGDGSVGTLLINAQITPTSTILAMLRRQFLYIMILVALVTAAIGYLMAAGISRPIIATSRAARELSRGIYRRPKYRGSYREIDELNDTLVKAAEDLGRVETLQRELIANISHDLRTPLTMIQGYAETMRDLPDESTPENMQVIIDETNRLSSLVNEVLEFSRLRAGAMRMNIGVFDLTETVRGICQRVSAMTEKDGYRVDCLAEGPCAVRGDSARIEQVVYNLLGNALTYTGGDRRVILREEDRGARVRISISDSGKGIDPAELPYIWDRYYRTAESHRRAVIGTGLGLNICRGILESHGVPYGADSSEGAGTTFWFELEKEEG